jgi:hypothetical protein
MWENKCYSAFSEVTSVYNGCWVLRCPVYFTNKTVVSRTFAALITAIVTGNNK